MIARRSRRMPWLRRASLALAALAGAVPATAVAQAEFRVTALSAPTVRNGVVGTAAQQFTGTGGTVEVLARFAFGGLHVRSFGADLDRGLGVANLDARVVLGPQWLSVEAGRTQRALVGELASSQYTLNRVGLRSTFPLGGSGLRGMIGAWSMQGATLPTGVREASGLEGETALLYRLRRLPVFVQVGYRAESYAVTLNGNRSAPEEMGVLTLGGGFSFGPAARR
ncbi:MAG: hypothetical protein ACK51E_08405 [Gemmatimonadota bacterium]|jgi:hypothetical protein